MSINNFNGMQMENLTIRADGGLELKKDTGYFGYPFFPVCNLTNYQTDPDIAADSKGNFIIVWQDLRGGNGYDIYAQRYDSNGNKNGTEIPVCLLPQSQLVPAIAVDTNDNFIMLCCINLSPFLKGPPFFRDQSG